MKLSTSNIYNGKAAKNFEVVLQMDDTHFKNCALLQNSLDSSERIISKIIEVKDTEKADDIIKKLSKLSNPFLLNLLNVRKTSKGNHFQYELYFDAFDSDLWMEMKARQVDRNYFTEEELWEILNSCLKGLSFLHDQEIYHSCLTPQFIKVVRADYEDSYKVKMLHPLILELIREDENERNSTESPDKTYLSPEEFISLKYEETKKYVDYFKADVYCLGLCMLEASTFFSIKSCYDWETFLMNYEFILRKLLIIHNRYSKHLAYVLKCMLLVDDRTRPTIFEIETLLATEKEIETDKRSLYLSPMRAKYKVEINVSFLMGNKMGKL